MGIDQYQKTTLPLASYIKAMIKETSISTYGKILEVAEDGNSALVETFRGDKLPLVIVYPSLENISVKYTIKEDDRVLCFFPKDFNPKEPKWEDKEIQFLYTYSPFCGLCFPIAEFNEKAQNTIEIDADGIIEFKNPHIQAKIDTTGEFSIKNDKTILSTDNNGNLSVSNGNGKIEMASGGTVKINNNLEISP